MLQNPSAFPYLITILVDYIALCTIFVVFMYLPEAGKECWNRPKLSSAPCFVESGHCHRLSHGSRNSSCRRNSWLWHSNPNSRILSNCLRAPEDPYTVRCMRNLKCISFRIVLVKGRDLRYHKVAIWLQVPPIRRMSKVLSCPRPTFVRPSIHRNSNPKRRLAFRQCKWNCWRCVWRKCIELNVYCRDTIAGNKSDLP